MVGIVSWGEFRDNLFYKILVLILLSYARYGCGCRGYGDCWYFVALSLVGISISFKFVLTSTAHPCPPSLPQNKSSPVQQLSPSLTAFLTTFPSPSIKYCQTEGCPLILLMENSLNIYRVNNIWHHGSHSLLDRFYLAFFSKTPKAQKGTIFFSIDNTLLYNPFHHDFGPFHVAHIFRFAKVLHDILGVDSFPSTILICRTKKPMTRLLSFTHIIHQKQGQTQHSSFLHIWYSFNLGRLIWFLRR